VVAGRANPGERRGAEHKAVDKQTETPRGKLACNKLVELHLLHVT